MEGKFKEIKNGDYVMNGMLKGVDGEEIYSKYVDITASRHLSVVFNLFVVF